MNIKQLLLAAGISIAAPACAAADMNGDLDALVAWTMEKPDKTELMPFDKAGLYEPHHVFHRSAELNGNIYHVSFTDRATYAESTFMPPDGKRGYADLLVFEKILLPDQPSDNRPKFHPTKVTFTDEQADGFVYGTPDVIEGKITIILDGKITVRMDEKGLAKQEFEEYVKLYADEISSFVRLVRP
jgi:hypothetical protein